jgi:hypothetical protein
LEDVVNQLCSFVAVWTDTPFAPVIMAFGSSFILVTEAVCYVYYTRYVSYTYNIMCENPISPACMCCIEVVTEKNVAQGLTVCLYFDWETPQDVGELVEAEF